MRWNTEKWGIRSRAQKVRRRVVAGRVALLSIPGARPRGRPRAFIPQLVVDYAVGLFVQLGSWRAVFARLASSGNGSWPRMTLIRHALQRKRELDKQAADPCHY